MKKIQVTILTALVAIAMVVNYQTSFAAQDEEKINSPKSSHITEEEQDKNGHDPIYEGTETIEIKFEDYDIESKVRVTKPGSDKTKEYEHEAGSVFINLSEILNEFDGDESGNKGGVFKVEITDSNGKTKTKNIKIKDQSSTEDPEAPSDEEQEEQEEEQQQEEQQQEEQQQEEQQEEEQQEEEQQEEEQQEEEQQEEEQQQEGTDTESELESEEEIDSEEAEEALSRNDKANKELEEQNVESTLVESSLLVIMDSEEALPQATPVVVIEENQPIPASAPTVQATLPKTGAVGATAISGLGAAMLLLGFAISKKAK